MSLTGLTKKIFVASIRLRTVTFFWRFFFMGNPTLDEVKAAASALMLNGSSVNPSRNSNIGLTCESGHPISATHTGALYEDCTGMAMRAVCSGGEFTLEW